MATIRRSRTFDASPDEIWSIVADPHHMPRWWPRVKRVEAVAPDGFTQVLTTDKGTSIKADFIILQSTPPTLWRWAQELVDTPFQRILTVSETEIVLEPDPPSGEHTTTRTRVTVSRAQQLRGLARLGSWMVSRASGRQLDEALGGLAGLLAPAPPVARSGRER